MERAGRAFEEGRIYHIYNRVAGGWRAFSDDEPADRFLHLFRLVVNRDEVVVFGWSLLGNHFHLILKQGPVSLSRSLKTLQQGVTRSRNLRDRTFGPLWQGRFKAKEVSDQKYLMQLVAYVHLNPVKAGLESHYLAIVLGLTPQAIFFRPYGACSDCRCVGQVAHLGDMRTST